MVGKGVAMGALPKIALLGKGLWGRIRGGRHCCCKVPPRHAKHQTLEGQLKSTFVATAPAV